MVDSGETCIIMAVHMCALHKCKRNTGNALKQIVPCFTQEHSSGGTQRKWGMVWYTMGNGGHSKCRLGMEGRRDSNKKWSDATARVCAICKCKQGGGNTCNSSRPCLARGMVMEYTVGSYHRVSHGDTHIQALVATVITAPCTEVLLQEVLHGILTARCTGPRVCMHTTLAPIMPCMMML